MSRIVLHVGPEKCASSTIQHAVLNPPPPIDNLLTGVLLEPRELLTLDCDRPTTEAYTRFHALIAAKRTEAPGRLLVFSHEMTFKLLRSVVNLADIARQHADEVVVVAYVRRQSDFLVSGFGQWLFRSPDRIAETAEILRAHGLDPMLFWGVERHLIAGILAGWEVGRQLSGHLYFDWSQSIPERAAALKACGASLSVGYLPRHSAARPLLSDFFARVGLDAAAGHAFPQVFNPAYPPALIEATLNAIESGYPMPGPHEANEFFEVATAATGAGAPLHPQFVTRLKHHIDTAFEAKNARFAKAYGLPSEYFAPLEHVDLDTIRTEIFAEAAFRAAIPEEQRHRERLSRSMLAQISWAAYQHRH